MNRKRCAQMMVMLVGAATLLPAGSVRAAEQPFTLTRAVPSDVFFCVAGKSNPEHAFIEAYWGDVFAAAKECGIGADFTALLSTFIGAEQMEEVNRLKDRARELLAGVDWSALGGGEMVFAERFTSTNMIASGDDVNIGPPDILLIFRGEKADKNYAGLVALLEGAVAEIRKAAGPEADALAIEQTEREGVKRATIPLMKPEKDGAGYSVTIAHRDDLVFIALGNRILDDSLALLAGGGKGASLATSPRYQAAFTSLPAAEDAAIFFDVQGMLKPIRGVIDLALAHDAAPDDEFKNTQTSGEAFELGEQALAAYRAGDKAKALELITQAAERDPKDTRILYNVACFNAINGKREAALAALTKAVDAGCNAPHQIAADSDLETLRDAPEFKQALAKATEQAKAQGGEGNDNVDAKALVDRLFGIPGMFDYIASADYTEGHSVHSKSVVALVPGAEKNPFYPVISGKPEGAKFDKYLPEETKSFSIAGGFNLKALYTFVADTFKVAGKEGQEAWGQWEQWQKDADFDVNKNVLDWLGGDCVTVTLAGPQGGSVMMVKVKDENVARTKVTAAVEFLSTKLMEAAADNPGLAMLSVRKSPVQHEKLEGFQNLFIGMSPQPVIWGVADGQLIFADKAEAIVTCLETAKGQHASVRKNQQVMSEALVPEGEYVSVTLTDQRNLGQELAAGIGVISMVSGFASMAIPDDSARKVIGQVAGMLMKLSPVVSKIDFYKSVASVTTFDGKAWHTHSVTHYVAPAERTASAAK